MISRTINSTFQKACCILLLLLLSWGCSFRPPWNPETSVLLERFFPVEIQSSLVVTSNPLYFESEGQTQLSKVSKKKLTMMMEDYRSQYYLNWMAASPEDYKIVVFGSSSVTEQSKRSKGLSIAKERAYRLADDMLMINHSLDKSHFEYVTLPVGQEDHDTTFSSDRFVYFQIVKCHTRKSLAGEDGLICADSVPAQQASFRTKTMDNPFIPDESYLEYTTKLVVDEGNGEVEIPFKNHYDYFLSPDNYQGSVKIEVKSKIFLDAFWIWNEHTVPLDFTLAADYSVGKNNKVKTVVHSPMKQSFQLRDDIRVVASSEGSGTDTIILTLEVVKDWI